MRAFAIVSVALMSLGAVARAEQPNVVFFLVDDLGYTDIACFGSTFYETPNIDALAASGVRFTDAYAACQVCSPTRASIMTGKYPGRLHTTDYFGAPQPQGWRRNTKLKPAAYVNRLPGEEVTIAEAFQSAGYTTFFAGKWHLGPEGSWPEDHGFEINKGGCQWGQPAGGKRYFSPYDNPRLEDGPDGEYLTDRLADETCKFIESQSTNRTAGERKPFFAYLSFYTVHNPMMAPKPIVEKYKQKREAAGESLADRWIEDQSSDYRKNRVRQVQNNPVYASMVESLDRAVGRVLETLREQGIEQNTIVVFTSDNGGLSTSEGRPTSNLPLRAGKGWIYEGGIREPTIVRWPGVTNPGSESDAVVTSTDYYPTLLEAAGLPRADDQHVDGKSFVAALRGEPYQRGPVFWHYPHYGNQGGSPSGAVRDGDWKLIEWFEDGRFELFNLEKDPGEHTNVVDDEPAIAARLKKLLEDWQAEAAVRMPVSNPKFRRPETN